MKLKNFRTKDLVPKADHFSLAQTLTEIEPLYKDVDHAKSLIKDFQVRLRDYQERLYAESQQSLLIIIQGMDTSGKDGLIEHLMTGINPQGVEIVSFKKPSEKELAHDFLWRAQCKTPRRGMIGIFNRSYYEDVIVTRVHPELLDAQNLPERVRKSDDFWDQRFESINNHEKFLVSQGWKIIKLFLHISADEQKKRLMKRIEEPQKRWKFNPDDLVERKSWDDYQRCFSECFTKTSTKIAPWHVIPSDDKKNARLIASEIILEAFEEMKPDFPKLSTKDEKAIRDSKKKLLGKK